MKRGELNRFEGAHMLSLHELQARFVDGLEGNEAALDELVVERGFSAAQRLQIYRNNYHSSLVGALAAVYPTVEKLVGEGFFSFLAHEFTRACPSRSGNLHDFGSELAHFLLRFKAAESLPYLSEVAVLEWRWHCAFHAADAPAFPLHALAEVPAERHADLQFSLHPSVALLSTKYPVSLIWEANQDAADMDITVNLDAGSETLLIARLQQQVKVVRLPAGDFALLEALDSGQTFGAACESALSTDANIDLSATLPALIGNGTLCDFRLLDDGNQGNDDSNINNTYKRES